MFEMPEPVSIASTAPDAAPVWNYRVTLAELLLLMLGFAVGSGLMAAWRNYALRLERPEISIGVDTIPGPPPWPGTAGTAEFLLSMAVLGALAAGPPVVLLAAWRRGSLWMSLGEVLWLTPTATMFALLLGLLVTPFIVGRELSLLWITAVGLAAFGSMMASCCLALEDLSAWIDPPAQRRPRSWRDDVGSLTCLAAWTFIIWVVLTHAASSGMLGLP